MKYINIIIVFMILLCINNMIYACQNINSADLNDTDYILDSSENCLYISDTNTTIYFELTNDTIELDPSETYTTISDDIITCNYHLYNQDITLNFGESRNFPLNNLNITAQEETDCSINDNITLNFGESRTYPLQNLTINAPTFPYINLNRNLGCEENYLNAPYNLTIINTCNNTAGCSTCPTSTQTINITHDTNGTCESGKKFYCEDYPTLNISLSPGGSDLFLSNHILANCSSCAYCNTSANCPTCPACATCPTCPTCTECTKCTYNPLNCKDICKTIQGTENKYAIDEFVIKMLAGGTSINNCSVKSVVNGTNFSFCPEVINTYCSQKEIETFNLTQCALRSFEQYKNTSADYQNKYNLCKAEKQTELNTQEISLNRLNTETIQPIQTFFLIIGGVLFIGMLVVTVYNKKRRGV